MGNFFCLNKNPEIQVNNPNHTHFKEPSPRMDIHFENEESKSGIKDFIEIHQKQRKPEEHNTGKEISNFYNK